jgi:hypothetical protein
MRTINSIATVQWNIFPVLEVGRWAIGQSPQQLVHFIGLDLLKLPALALAPKRATLETLGFNCQVPHILVLKEPQMARPAAHILLTLLLTAAALPLLQLNLSSYPLKLFSKK